MPPLLRSLTHKGCLRFVKAGWGLWSMVMKSDTTTSRSRDILSNRLLSFALFCLPVIAIVATG